MSRLLAIIDAYKDTHGQPSDASIARAVGVAPQTISSWRKRGIRELPARDTLMRLADFMRVPYDRPYPGSVLEAALVDAGYASPQPEQPREVGDDGRSAAM